VTKAETPSSLGIGIAGCPQNCRYCFLGGSGGTAERGEEFVREVYCRFADHAKASGHSPPEVYLYQREPFFHSRRQDMAALEEELNGGKVSGRDLIATVGWRIAREPEFAGRLEALRLPRGHDDKVDSAVVREIVS